MICSSYVCHSAGRGAKAALLACLVLAVHLPAYAADGLSALRQFVAQTQSFRAGFIQTITPRQGGEARQTTGKIAFVRPNRFRWEIEKPYPQLMVADGTRVWVFDPDLQQVTRRKLDQSIGQTPAALLAGDGTLDKAFILNNLERTGEGMAWVDATPRSSDSGFTRIRLGFRGAQLKAMEMEDAFAQKIRIDFLRVEQNPSLSAEQFRFTPPPGVDILGD